MHFSDNHACIIKIHYGTETRYFDFDGKEFYEWPSASLAKVMPEDLARKACAMLKEAARRTRRPCTFEVAPYEVE